MTPVSPLPRPTPQPLRIALVSEHASPLALLGGVDAGGQNVHVAELARHLGELGAVVTVHTRRDDPALPASVAFAPNVTVDHVTAGPAIPLPKDELVGWMDDFAADLHRCWQHQPPDVVHAHFWMSGLAALAAARSLGIPVALTFHALGITKRRHQGAADTSPEGRIGQEARLASEVDLLLATSRQELLELADSGARPRRPVVIPCGVDLSRFRCTPRQPTTGHEEGRLRVVVLSRLVPRKGIADVVAAVAELPEVDLVVAGGPPAVLLDHDSHARELAGLARRLGVAHRVELAGAIPRGQVPGLLRSADVVVCSPWYEPFGMVAVEAMACGVPVVASAVGGLTETVVDGRTGLLVPPRAPHRLTAALARLQRDPALRAAMGAAGARRAARYGWRTVAAQTYGELHALARRATPAGDRRHHQEVAG